MHKISALNLVLLTALGYGLLFVFLVPPWEHYDEPTHFEYTWLMAHGPGIPAKGESKPEFRRLINASMIQTGFFGRRGGVNVASTTDIGVEQLGDPPAYYFLVGLPLRLIHFPQVENELRLIRFMSLLLFLVSVLAGWGVSSELFAPGNPLRWMLPLTMALWPGLADLMTAVNNDVGAIAFFSLFIWRSVRLVKRGFSWVDLVWTFIAAILAALMKGTAVIALPLALLAGVLSLVRGRKRWWVGGCLVGVGLAGVFFAFSWGDAYLWGGGNYQDGPTSVSLPTAPLGERVLKIDYKPAENNVLLQLIPQEDWLALRGQSATLGAYLWADKPVGRLAPFFMCVGRRTTQAEFSKFIKYGTAPAFFAMSFQIPEKCDSMYVGINLYDLTKEKIAFYYDGIVLLPGEWPASLAPEFAGPGAESGTWGGRPFKNMLRNPSFEAIGPRLRSTAYHAYEIVYRSMGGVFPTRLVNNLLDWKGVSWYWKLIFSEELRTFVAKFGWGNVPLLGYQPYLVIFFLMMAALPGVVLALWRRRFRLDAGMAGFLLLVLAGTWLIPLVKLLVALPDFPYQPVARYAYPGIIPSLLGLAVGWKEMLGLLGGSGRLYDRIPKVSYIVLLLCLAIFSLVSIVAYY